jgi:hypothetical protein
MGIPPELDAPPSVDAPVPDAANVDAMAVDAVLIDAQLIDAPTDAPPTPHVVFVTSTTSTGLIGGLAAADAHCQMLASSVGLGGQYKAILANATQTIYMRIRINGPVRNIRGITIAASSSAFHSATGLLPNNITERGDELLQPTLAWIGGGTQLSCGDWNTESASVNGGMTYVTSNQWTNLTVNTSCVSPSPRLQCISQ